jgi:hypothetical protein
MPGRFAVALAGAAILAVLSLTDAPTLAQEAQGTPSPRGEWLAELAGAEDAALRNFEASGLRLIGSLFLLFGVCQFDTPEHAEDAAPALGTRTVDNLQAPPGSGSLKPASVRPLGDQALAFAGTIEAPADDDSPIREATAAVLVVREAAFVHVMVGAAIAGDPLTDLAGIAEKVAGREPGGDETPVAADGLREGGLWDLLPRLADLPEGFVLDQEQVPAPFDPLPGQAADPTPAPTQFSSPGAAAPVGMRARIGDWAVAVDRTTLDATAVVQTGGSSCSSGSR